MVHIVLVLSGLADDPADELDGQTPLAAANTPYLDRLAATAEVGLFQPLPEREATATQIGADEAALAILGYEPQPSSRAALELLGAGATLGPRETGVRWDLISSSPFEPFPTPLTEAATAALWEDLAAACHRPGITLKPVGAMSGLMVWDEGPVEVQATPPGELAADTPLEGQYPVGDRAEEIARMIDTARQVLAEHALNRDRAARSLPPLDLLWPWGFGRAPELPLFATRAGLLASLVGNNAAAVGAGRAAGLTASLTPPQADRKLKQRMNQILNLAQRTPTVVAYASDPDRAGHAGDPKAKASLLTRFDNELIKPLVIQAVRSGDMRFTVLSDFATPCATRRHEARPVPYLDSNPQKPATGPGQFTEATAAETGHRKLGATDCRGWLWGG